MEIIGRAAIFYRKKKWNGWYRFRVMAQTQMCFSLGAFECLLVWCSLVPFKKRTRKPFRMIKKTIGNERNPLEALEMLLFWTTHGEQHTSFKLTFLMHYTDWNSRPGIYSCDSFWPHKDTQCWYRFRDRLIFQGENWIPSITSQMKLSDTFLSPLLK